MAVKKTKKTFTKEMADVVLDLGKEGASQKAMYAAIGISKDTAARWKDEDPYFKEVMSMATTHGQAFWENMMLANIDNKGFNSRIAEIALRGQFQQDYRENRDTKVDAKVDVVIDFKGEVAKLLDDLKKAS